MPSVWKRRVCKRMGIYFVDQVLGSLGSLLIPCFAAKDHSSSEELIQY